MFDQLQCRLQQIYEIETCHRVSNFITTNQSIRQCMINNGADNTESVFVQQQDDYLNISVFLDQDVVDGLYAESDEIDINHMCHALEGVSHFLYLIFNAGYDRAVSLMELELQAEVDKFIVLLQNSETRHLNHSVVDLHQTLFAKVCYRDSLNGIEQQRYKDANFYAGKLCSDLLKRHQLMPDWQSMNLELRRFYRLPLQQKIQHINQLH